MAEMLFLFLILKRLGFTGVILFFGLLNMTIFKCPSTTRNWLASAAAGKGLCVSVCLCVWEKKQKRILVFFPTSRHIPLLCSLSMDATSWPRTKPFTAFKTLKCYSDNSTTLDTYKQHGSPMPYTLENKTEFIKLNCQYLNTDIHGKSYHYIVKRLSTSFLSYGYTISQYDDITVAHRLSIKAICSWLFLFGQHLFLRLRLKCTVE